MARSFAVYLPMERPWTQKGGWARKGVLAVEVLDAVTLQRMHVGIQVVAQGLQSTAVVNHGGLFTWRGVDLAGFSGIAVDPGLRPYVGIEVAAADMTLPMHAVALQPRADYPFAPGTTAIRGALFESMPAAGIAAAPVVDARVRLEWLDDDGNWHAPPQRFRTDARGGFTAFVHFVSTDEPEVAGGNLQLRLFAQRTGVLSLSVERSIAFAHPQGRTTDVIHAWDQMT